MQNTNLKNTLLILNKILELCPPVQFQQRAVTDPSDVKPQLNDSNLYEEMKSNHPYIKKTQVTNIYNHIKTSSKYNGDFLGSVISLKTFLETNCVDDNITPSNKFNQANIETVLEEGMHSDINTSLSFEALCDKLPQYLTRDAIWENAMYLVNKGHIKTCGIGTREQIRFYK